MKRPPTLLADDHPVFLAGLERLLEPEFDVVATATDGLMLIDKAKHFHPELIVTDISMPLLGGLDATRRLVRLRPQSKLVILTMHADPSLVIESVAAGARAYLLKRDAGDELINALHQVLAGKTCFPFVMGESGVTGEDDAFRLDVLTAKLSARQWQILQLIAEGKTHKEIANTLHMSPKTVEFHKYRMTRLLGLHTTAELTRASIQADIGKVLEVRRICGTP